MSLIDSSGSQFYFDTGISLGDTTKLGAETSQQAAEIVHRKLQELIQQSRFNDLQISVRTAAFNIVYVHLPDNAVEQHQEKVVGLLDGEEIIPGKCLRFVGKLDNEEKFLYRQEDVFTKRDVEALGTASNAIQPLATAHEICSKIDELTSAELVHYLCNILNSSPQILTLEAHAVSFGFKGDSGVLQSLKTEGWPSEDMIQKMNSIIEEANGLIASLALFVRPYQAHIYSDSFELDEKEREAAENIVHDLTALFESAQLWRNSLPVMQIQEE